MMQAAWLPAISASLQLAAASLAFRMIRVTGRRRAWILTILTFLALATYEIVSLPDYVRGRGGPPVAWQHDLVVLVTSALLLAGIVFIGRIFRDAKAHAAAAALDADRLLASERRYRFLVERIPEAFVVVVEGQLAFANRAFTKIFGVPLEEALGRPLADFVPGELAAAEGDVSSGAKSPTWAGSRREVEIRDPAGSTRWLEVRLQVGEWEGRPAEIGLIQDITERQHARGAVSREENLFARGPVVLFRWRPAPSRAASYVSANVAHWGFSPKELVAGGQSFYTFIHPDDRDRVHVEASAYLSQGAPSWEQEYRLVCPDGQVRWVFDVTVVNRGAGGEVSHLDGYLLDISDRRRAEEALRGSEERYRLAVQATQDVMYDRDLANDLVFWSQNTSGVFGSRPEEMGLRSADWKRRIHPEDLARVEDAFEEALRGGEVFLSEYRFRRHDGSYAAVLDRGLIVRDASHKATRVVGAITDLPERKRLEEQLRLAQKIEALGHLAGGIAHDFNNLLTAILGSCELLQRRWGSRHEIADELTTIHRTASRAAELTRGLLAFARRQVLEPVDLDLNELVRGELPILRRLIPENVAIDHIPGYRLGTVNADPSQLQQVLVNLCVNGRDAMPQGGRLTIETENVVINSAYLESHPWAREGRYVMLSVSDSGVGMSAETMSRIFEPFFTTKPPGHGTGLGLATVYGIVKQHDGMVHAYSERGKGSTFKVYLPQVERRASEVGDKIAGPVKGGDETILVVEDEAEVRQVLVEVLSSLGYRVLQAADGLEGLEMMSEEGNDVDLIITDVVMPRMGGKELQEAVLRVAPRTLFLFSSGYSENAVHEGFVKKEGVFFIAKPYGIDTLARKVREVLDTRRREQ